MKRKAYLLLPMMIVGFILSACTDRSAQQQGGADQQQQQGMDQQDASRTPAANPTNTPRPGN